MRIILDEVVVLLGWWGTVMSYETTGSDGWLERDSGWKLLACLLACSDTDVLRPSLKEDRLE